MVNLARPNLIDAPGTSETAWQSWPGLRQLPVLDITRWASAVVVAAHPDDEVLGAGGIIAALAARGGAGTLWYPVWMWHWARPSDPRVPWRAAVRVPLPRSVTARKRQAIGCFASQLRHRGAGLGPVLPAGIVAHFIRDMEVLFPVRGR